MRAFRELNCHTSCLWIRPTCHVNKAQGPLMRSSGSGTQAVFRPGGKMSDRSNSEPALLFGNIGKVT
jgi:hypothetical protein